MGKLVMFVGLSFFLVVAGADAAFGQAVLKVGTIPIVHEMPLHAAIANGYFAQEGIKVETRIVVGGAKLIPALAGGSLQMGHSAYVSVFPARARGFDISIVYPYVQQPPGRDNSAIVVRTDSGINTARDLEGKTLVVNVIKSLNWLYATEWISRSGLDPKKVKWTEVPFPTMLVALRTKRVDGAYATEPFVTMEMERGGMKIIGRPFSEIDPAPQISGIVAMEKWLKANKGLVKRFARALRKGTDYVNAHPEKYVSLLKRYTRMKPEWVPKLIMPQWKYPINITRLQAASDLALKWGLISKKQDVRKFVWPTALK
ncbi:MAG: ABC transporter substrate-binding protein [Thermodesulfobacteriota bacterium]